MEIILVDQALRTWMQGGRVLDGQPCRHFLKVHGLYQNAGVRHTSDAIAEAKCFTSMRQFPQGLHHEPTYPAVNHALQSVILIPHRATERLGIYLAHVVRLCEVGQLSTPDMRYWRTIFTNPTSAEPPFPEQFRVVE